VVIPNPAQSTFMSLRIWTIDADDEEFETILEFNWPDGAGSLNGVIFWGALMDSQSLDLMILDSVEWGFGI